MTDVNKKIETGISAFLSQYRDESHVGMKWNEPEGAYYWSEQDAQFELLEKLRQQFKGTKYRAHAEGPLLARRKGERSKRADIVIIDRTNFLEWHRDWLPNPKELRKKDRKGKDKKKFPKYEAVIELKIVWRGLLPGWDNKERTWRWGGATDSNTEDRIEKDLDKLHKCLKGQKKLTKEAHLILLDSIILNTKDDRCGLPFYLPDTIKKLREPYDKRIHLWHWPHSEEPVRLKEGEADKEDVSANPWKHYPLDSTKRT